MTAIVGYAASLVRDVLMLWIQEQELTSSRFGGQTMTGTACGK